MGFVLLIGGLTLVGASVYKLYGNRIMNNWRDENAEIAPLWQNGGRVNMAQYDPLPQPISVKPLLVALTLALFGLALYSIYYLVNYSETVSGKFWLFLLIVGFFGFGCYFVSLVGKADAKLEEKVKRVTIMNNERLLQKAQAVKNSTIEYEETRKAQLLDKKMENELLLQHTVTTDQRILQSNTEEAMRRQIPVSAYTRIKTDDFATQVAIENLKKVKTVERTDENERAQDKNRIEKEKAHNVLNASERAEYNRLKWEFDEKLRTLYRELAELNAKTSLAPTEQADVKHLETVIKETEEDKDALRRNFLRSSHGEETPRLS